MDPRNVENDNCFEQEEDHNQTPVNPPLPSLDKIIKILPQAQNVNLYNLDDTGYYTEGEDAFVTSVAWHQHSTQRL
ncbi:40715_t:CDS:2 [Gigaspora margarita]|uniref:40715_t:CDS:1 n=1 Tax=Gigaspora margarita TaxID=4874 RepID=A0ABN7VCI8_GIGMA|nr:40715_t:CDS:2 [Gigaspora margarita]